MDTEVHLGVEVGDGVGSQNTNTRVPWTLGFFWAWRHLQNINPGRVGPWTSGSSSTQVPRTPGTPKHLGARTPRCPKNLCAHSYGCLRGPGSSGLWGWRHLQNISVLRPLGPWTPGSLTTQVLGLLGLHNTWVPTPMGPSGTGMPRFLGPIWG